MKIAHISDVHIGYSQYRIRQRKLDFFFAFERALQRTKELNVDLVIIAGDLFDSINPDIESLLFVKDIISKYKELRFIIIPGNHDKVSSFTNKSPVQVLENLSNVLVICETKRVRISDLFFYFLPMQVSDMNDFFVRVDTPRQNNVLVYHGIVTGFDDPFFKFLDNDMYPSLDEIKTKFSIALFGDIHKRLFYTDDDFIAAYSGAVEFNSYTEVQLGTRGFGLLDTKTRDYKYIDIEGRPYIILDDSVDVVKCIRDIDRDTMVFIETSKPDLYNKYKALSKLYKFVVFNVFLRSDKQSKELLLENDSLATVSLDDILKKMDFPYTSIAKKIISLHNLKKSDLIDEIEKIVLDYKGTVIEEWRWS